MLTHSLQLAKNLSRKALRPKICEVAVFLGGTIFVLIGFAWAVSKDLQQARQMEAFYDHVQGKSASHRTFMRHYRACHSDTGQTHGESRSLDCMTQTIVVMDGKIPDGMLLSIEKDVLLGEAGLRAEFPAGVFGSRSWQ